jgi:hypothetical protein
MAEEPRAILPGGAASQSRAVPSADAVMTFCRRRPTALLWDAETGLPIGELTGRTDRAASAAFSLQPHGQRDKIRGCSDSGWAGIDLLTGKVGALVHDRHRSRELIAFLGLRDTPSYGDQVDWRQSFPPPFQGDPGSPIRLPAAWKSPSRLAQPRRGLCFQARLLRSPPHRVTSKQQLKDRIIAAMDHFKDDPDVHTGS